MSTQPSALDAHTHTHLEAHHGDFETFAALMAETHTRRFDPVFWAFIERHGPAAIARIVDLGTGPGLLLPDLLARFSGAHATGVDAQPAMLTRAADAVASCANAALVQHDLALPGLPIADDSVDLAIASMVVHELQVPTVLMREAFRMLKPGGVWIVYDWVRQPLSHYAEGTLPETLDAFTHFSEHCRYTPEDVTWMLEQVGFVVDEWAARHHGRHALFAARKPS